MLTLFDVLLYGYKINNMILYKPDCTQALYTIKPIYYSQYPTCRCHELLLFNT